MTHFFVRLFFSFHFCDYFHTMSWQREADEKEFLNKRPLRWFVLVSGRITTVCRGLYSARPAIYHSKSKIKDTHTNIDIEIFFPDSFLIWMGWTSVTCFGTINNGVGNDSFKDADGVGVGLSTNVENRKIILFSLSSFFVCGFSTLLWLFFCCCLVMFYWFCCLSNWWGKG